MLADGALSTFDEGEKANKYVILESLRSLSCYQVIYLVHCYQGPIWIGNQAQDN